MRRQGSDFLCHIICIYIYCRWVDQRPERIALMRKVVSLLTVLAVGAGFLACAGTNRAVKGGVGQNQSASSRPELEYLKAVNGTAPPQDPQLLFLLMSAYANASQQAEGADQPDPRKSGGRRSERASKRQAARSASDKKTQQQRIGPGAKRESKRKSQPARACKETSRGAG